VVGAVTVTFITTPVTPVAGDPVLAGHLEREGAAAADRRGGHPAEAGAGVEQSGRPEMT
jgi:hypothetical protein